jgi:DNA (cytosine-5)-methyltransferase 1
MAEHKYTVVDLFSGAGGFSLGFEMAGFKIIGGLELDKWASETFQKNNPTAKVITQDITNVSNINLKTMFDSPDIVLGGPPCQGFSIANRNAGDPKDPRNTLFMEFIRAVKVLNPKIAIIENVPNILNAKTESGEKVINIIRMELKNLGYGVESQILEAVKFGVPQIRKRLFVIASKLPLKSYFPEPIKTESDYTTLWDAISDLPKVIPRDGYEEMNYDSEPKNDFQKEMRKDSIKVYNHISMKHSNRMIERFSKMKWGDSISDVPNSHKPLKRNGNGVISEKSYDQNNRRMYPDKPCHTIPASFYANFVHPFENRNFTAREGARLQSFPDYYRFFGKPTVVSHKLLEREGRTDEKFLGQYNQIGNAVPPLLAKAIALNIISQL